MILVVNGNVAKAINIFVFFVVNGNVIMLAR